MMELKNPAATLLQNWASAPARRPRSLCASAAIQRALDTEAQNELSKMRIADAARSKVLSLMWSRLADDYTSASCARHGI